MGDAATETPRRAASRKSPIAPLRAPQPEPASPFFHLPSLSAPQPKDDQSVLSKAPKTEIEGTERRYERATKHSSTDQKSVTNKRRVNRRNIRRERQASTISRHSITSKGSRSSKASSRSGSMEPENDAGAQPLHMNVVRKPSFNVSMAEAEGTPYASVTRFRASDTTAPTLEISYDNSMGSNNFARYNNNNDNHIKNNNFSNENIANLEAARLNAKLKKYQPRTSKMTSFSGDITTSSWVRSSRATSSDPDDDDEPRPPLPRISASCSPNEDRISSTSFSAADFAGSRGSSVFAEVVDEAQLEAEFNERLKSRIVEAVEIRPSRCSDGDGDGDGDGDDDVQIPTSFAAKRNSHNTNGSRNGSRAGSKSGGSYGSKQSERRRKRAEELARLKKQRRLIRCVIVCTTTALVLGLLITMLLLLLRYKRDAVGRRADNSDRPVEYDTSFFDLDDDTWRSGNSTEYGGLTFADVFLLPNDD